MAFLEERFPLDVNLGTQGGPVFSTDVVRFGNGKEYRNNNWSRPLYRYDIVYRAKSRTQALEVYEFFLARQGRFEGFRVRDVWDYTSATDGKTAPANSDQAIGTGDGVETDFQLIKTYTQGAASQVREIYKPVSSTVVVAVNAVAQTEGVDFTVDTTTGIISFNVAPADTLPITAGYEYDVPVRFDTDDLSNLQLIISGVANDYASYENIPLVEIRV